MASASLNSSKSGQTDHSEPNYLSHHSKMQESNCRKYSTPSLSEDSGIYFESSQLLDDTERPSNRSLYHHLDMNGFSEEELLNITFEACDTTGKGEVLASTVVQYLHSVTSHSAGEDKLLILQHMLDPEDQDPSVSRDTFHETMNKWIAQCSQASYQASGSESCRAAVNEDEYAPLLTEAMLIDQNECHCESSDLLSLVAELKHAQRRLSRHNSSLLRTVSQCEETNLQLTLEVSELRSKLTSAQMCVGRARVLAEELDETRRDLRESQERTARVQANSNSLMKANEHLKAQIKIIEEMNEKLLHERNSAEDRLNKLRRTNVNIREELEKMCVLLAVKEREMTKKDITLRKLKDTYLEYHRIIESLQSDLLKLQEHSEQALLRFDMCSSHLGLKSGGIPNHFSLHHEILKAQPRTSMDENSGPLPEIQPHTCSEKDLQNIIDMIKSADFKQLIHNTQISDWDTYTADLLQGQGDQTSSKHQFLTILKELECPRLPLEQHQEHKLAETNQQMQEAHKAISWWKALRVESNRNCTKQETQEANKDMQERIKFLEAELKVAQLEKEEKAFQDTQVQANKKDAAVETELDRNKNRGEADQHLATEMLDSLRKVEALVEKALQAANFLTEGERRMKAISHRVEKALCRTVETTNHLSTLEAQVSTCTLSTDLSARHDEGLVDASHPIIFRSTKCAGPQPISYSGSLKISSKTNGGLYLCSGAEDNVQESHNNQETFQDAADQTRALNDSCETFLICVKADISEAASSDSFPVGLLNKHSSPEQNESSQSKPVAAHGPLPETVLNSACEEPTLHRTRENVAGSEEPNYGSVSLLKSEKNKRNVVLPEEGYPDLISRSECNEDPSHNLHDSGQIQEESASSESEPSKDTEVLDLLKRGQSSEPEHWDQTVQILNFDLKQVLSKSSGKFQEESETSGRSQDETNKTLKEPQSGPFKALQTSASAGTLKQDISAVCGEAASRATPSSPSPCYLAVPETNTPFFFPHTRSRPTTAPTMPTLPEEEEDSPEEIDSSSKSPFFIMPVQTKLVNVTIATPAIVLPRQACKQEIKPLVKTRPHSPRPRLSRNPSSGPITTVDNDGHVIDLIKDELPELQLSDEDRQKNLELLEEAKKVSDRFLTRRGRRSTCSLSDSPTALSPNQTPGSSPVPSRSSSLSTPPSEYLLPSTVSFTENTASSSPTSQRLEVPAVVVRDYGEANKFDQESLKKLVELKLPEKRKVSSGTLKPRPATAREFTVSQKDSTETILSTERGKKPAQSPVSTKLDSPSPATGVAKPVPRPPMQQAPCTAEIKTIGAFPPLMRAVSWDTVGSLNVRNEGAQGDEGLCFSDTSKSSGSTQKLSKLREEHKLIRNQSICGTKLPDLNETAEQDRESHSTTTLPVYEESKEKADALPIISDVMLRKLKLHRGLPGCAPPLTEKEVENSFVQLSLAFRNDNYTLETRLKQADRDRNLTEENTEKELEEFKNSLKSTSPLWQNAEQRENYQRLIETVSVLHRLANRLSSRAEMVGAVRQEKRMNKATEVMLQYVENLKRTYEKDHAELMEFKKLANQNSNRSYSGSMETGDDGVPRTSRSMSLTMGKALPRRRVSVAVVPKFNLLNIPGQSPTTAGSAAGPSALPVLCEANSQRSDTSSDPAQQTAAENGKVLLEQEGEGATPTKVSCNLEEIRAEIKAKIEEEAYNKGYQEGLKRLKELQDVKEEEKKVEDKLKESDEITEEDLEIEDRPPSKFEGALEILDRICPKIFKRNRTLWIMLTLFLALFILVNLINFFSNLYSDHTDTSPANVPNKKFLGLRVGSKNPSRTE